MTRLLSRIDSKTLGNYLKEEIEPSEIFSIVELEDTQSLKESRKRVYKIQLRKDQSCIHLTYGFQLDEVFQKQAIAYKLIPQIICKPQFIIDLGDSLYLYAQEFWDGVPLDNLDDESKISEILVDIDAKLSSLVIPSTSEAMHHEWRSFKNELISVTELNRFDKDIIENVISPAFESFIVLAESKKRWSCGDLAARNILVSDNYEFRIIDLEFSTDTHFYHEDWFRLMKYSNEKLSVIPIVQEKIENLPPYTEAYFWLRQFILDGIVHQGKSLYSYLKLNLANALQTLNLYHSELKPNSLFIDGLLGVCDDHLTIIEKKVKETASLTEKIEATNKKLLSTNEKLLSVSRKVEVLFDKVHRMQSSFSWRSTAFLRFLRRKLSDPYFKSGKNFKKTFSSWSRMYDTIDKNRLTDFRDSLKTINFTPKISIILPVYNPNPLLLKKAIGSVIDQIYTNWELCIVDDASESQEIRNLLGGYEKKDERIKIHFSEKNQHISLTSNKALELSTGKFICLLDHDDELRPHSLLVLAETINKYPEAKLIYSDEDKIDLNGNRSGPYFKPDWNPELLLSQNYFCHLVCIQESKVTEVGAFRKGFEGSQDWDLFLRITETLLEKEIIHIPQILYHWRKSHSSTAKSLTSKDYILKSAKKTLAEALMRRKIQGKVISSNSKFSYWRIRRDLPPKKPLVSILIPTKNRLDYLKKCIDSIVSKTIYDNYELIILDNESNEADCIKYLESLRTERLAKIIEIKGEFNYSKINNIGVKQASGEIVALVNNDIEVISNDWLCEMVSHVVREEIGCVGAKLLYPDKTIQHAGVILGLGGVAGHAYKRFPKDHPGQLYRLHLLQNYEAVTAACLLVRKSVYQEVNGLDEKKFKVAFNDVDFCLKVRKKGYRNLWTPYAVLFHHESVTRGSDQKKENHQRFINEVNEMKKMWKSSLEHDPTYNPNLTYDREDFSLAFPPKHHSNGIL